MLRKNQAGKTDKQLPVLALGSPPRRAVLSILVDVPDTLAVFHG